MTFGAVLLVFLALGPCCCAGAGNSSAAAGDVGRAPAVPPWNRTRPLGARCRVATDCERNGRCVANGGFGLALTDHYTLIARTKDEDKWMHWVQVGHVDPGSAADHLGIREGDFVEHIGSIRDDSAYDATQRLLKLFAKLETSLESGDVDGSDSTDHAQIVGGVRIGLLRPPDPLLKEMNYGGVFNVSLVLAPGEKLGLKLSNTNNFGIKIKKVHDGGAAALAQRVVYEEDDNDASGGHAHEERSDLDRDSSKPPYAALLKNDFIRKVNGIKIESNSTISQFVQKIKLARKSNATDASGLTHVLLRNRTTHATEKFCCLQEPQTRNISLLWRRLCRKSPANTVLLVTACAAAVGTGSVAVDCASCRHCPCL